jgi:hypothetical protein
MKPYSLADLARITGAKPRSVQLWADAGVVKAIPETERAGSGTHRQFTRDEAMIACIVAAFAERKVAIGGLIEIGEAIRSLPALKRRDSRLDFLGDAVRRSGENFMIAYWNRRTGRAAINFVSSNRFPDAEPGFFELFKILKDDRRIADVVSLNACLKDLDSV